MSIDFSRLSVRVSLAGSLLVSPNIDNEDTFTPLLATIAKNLNGTFTATVWYGELVQDSEGEPLGLDDIRIGEYVAQADSSTLRGAWHDAVSLLRYNMRGKFTAASLGC